MSDMNRRTVLKLALGGAGVAAFPAVGATPAAAADRGPDVVGVGDDSITVEFDDRLHTRVALKNVKVTRFDPSEALVTSGATIDKFDYRGHETQRISHPRHGAGVQVTVRGDSANGVRKTVQITSYQRLAGMLVMSVSYANLSGSELKVTGWRNGAHELLEKPAGFYTFSGTTHEDRRDWVQPMVDGFDQKNSLGMDASDYGGGTPMASV